MNPARLDELINHYIDRRLSPEEKAELEACLLASAEARRQFWELLQFEEILEETADIHRSAEWMTQKERAKTHAIAHQGAMNRYWHGWVQLMSCHPILTAAAAVVFVALSGLPFFKPRALPVAEPTSNGVAVLASTLDVQWDPEQTPLVRGAALPPGRIRLAKGVAGIEFYSGVRLTLEGPVDIELKKIDEAVCYSGKLRVQVPAVATNFRVLTPNLDVLDLGTEFGMDVSRDHRTEVHVFEGKVEWSNRNSPSVKNLLVAGEGIRADIQGVAHIAAQSEVFVSRSRLETQIRQQIAERQLRWAETAEHLRNDPRLVLFYELDSKFSSSGYLRNLSQQTQRRLDGVIVGCDWSEGRWPGQTALEFKHPSDRVRVAIPGEFENLTYAAWVRVDRIDAKFSALFLTDKFETGAPHWQITGGRIRLGIGDSVGRKTRTATGHGVEVAQTGVDYDSPVVFKDADLGRWRHLAVVVDGEHGEVRHYMDGRLLSTAPVVVPQKLRIGDAELGNWGLPAPEEKDPQPIRNLNGRMDEFMIFKSALPDAEIRALYEQGQPTPPSTLAAIPPTGSG